MNDAYEQRILELEQRVRQFSDVVACIPMAAAALNLLPIDQYSRAMRNPVEAMHVLEEISKMAERWAANRDWVLSMFGQPGLARLEKHAGELVAARRSKIEREVVGVRHLLEQS